MGVISTTSSLAVSLIFRARLGRLTAALFGCVCCGDGLPQDFRFLEGVGVLFFFGFVVLNFHRLFHHVVVLGLHPHLLCLRRRLLLNQQHLLRRKRLQISAVCCCGCAEKVADPVVPTCLHPGVAAVAHPVPIIVMYAGPEVRVVLVVVVMLVAVPGFVAVTAVATAGVAAGSVAGVVVVAVVAGKQAVVAVVAVLS